MRSLVIGAALAVALLLAPNADAQTLYTCGTATVRTIEAVAGTEITPVFREITNPSEEGSIVTEIVLEPKPIAYIVTVQLRDVVYIGRSQADVPWNFDPTALARDQQIAACANDREMVLDRLDGTDYRASVISIHIEVKEAGDTRER